MDFVYFAIVGLVSFVIGGLCGVSIVMFMLAKDRTVVRLREGEVVMPKAEVDAMVKSLSQTKKREILES